MRLHAVEKWVTGRLDAPMMVVRSDVSMEKTRLNQAERKRFNELRHERRRREWLLGRNALKQLLTTLDRGDDTTAVSFPDRQVSLTHGGDTAFAAGTTAASRGIGIDYEPLREIDTRIARWFLNEAETNWLNEQPECDRVAQLVRLWTIKEAAFKSYPNNAGMTFKEFSIIDAAAAVTTVVATGHGACIRVACRACDPGYLSIAICRESP
ncbi:MAG: 4-phosphopantetheinyl transferase family protein [Proteobacteria bacterium]|nr:4-phosphopantetheinyl transferase family protein [Pseudomonadota bacterium]